MTSYLCERWRTRKTCFIFIVTALSFCVYLYHETYGFVTLFTTSHGRRNIIMVETSDRSSLNPRQACAVESGARQNPNMDVVIYMTTTDVDIMDGHMAILSSIPNVQFVQIDLGQLFRGTLLESWYVKNQWQRSRFKIVHLSDAIRLLLLYQKGGIYMDLDVVVMKPLDDLWNCTGQLRNVTICNGVMAFDKGHVFLKLCLEEFADRYDGNKLAYNGPNVLSRVYNRVCGGIENIHGISRHRCHGVTILPMHSFYAIDVGQWKDFFRAEGADKVIKKWKDSYLIHVWNKLSSGTKVIIGSKQPYEIAASKFCPATYHLSLKNGVF